MAVNRKDELVLFERPSWWNFFWHITIFWVGMPALFIYLQRIGFFEKLPPEYWRYSWYFWCICALVVLGIILWDRAALKLYVYKDRVVVERGVLSKEYKELFIKDIRTIDVKQSLVQRVVNIGRVMMASAGTSGYEIDAKGLPGPRKIKNTVLSLRDGILEGGE